MNVHEFLKSTETRKFRNDFDSMMKERRRGWADDLQARRERLYCQLRTEQLEWEEAMAEWVQAQAEAAVRQRHEWIGLERLKKERAEQELLKLHSQKCHLENCAEMRELQSKQLLLETKSAQRDQIEERMALRRRQAEIERLWLTAWQRLHDIRAQQEDYEQKLRRVIAVATQAENSAREEEARLRNAFPDDWALHAGRHAHTDALNSKQETSQNSKQQRGKEDSQSRLLAQLSEKREDWPKDNNNKWETDGICGARRRPAPMVQSQSCDQLETECGARKEAKKHPYSKSVR